jgi:uncharacterized protein (DUF488 family)
VPLERILTIGVYGFTEERFFRTLAETEADLFCDLRARPGVRGREYAFANARRLQNRLDELALTYVHFPQLAPTPEMRASQRSSDVRSGVAKRQREVLSSAFVIHYRSLLDGRAAQDALTQIALSVRAPVLFCVEREAAACHRSLVAEALASHPDIPVEHLTP